MSHVQFLDLLRSIYKSFLRCIEGLQASSSVLIELLDSRLYVPLLLLLFLPYRFPPFALRFSPFAFRFSPLALRFSPFALPLSHLWPLIKHRPSDYPADISVLQDNLFDILSSSAELANILSSKLLSARAEQHTKLELSEFVELFNESWAFVVRCEVICRRMIVGLRGVVVGQVCHISTPPTVLLLMF